MIKLPPGWTSALIDDLGELRLGKMLDKAKNQGLPAKYLRNINVRWFRFNLEDMHTIFASPAEIEQLSVRDGDLFVCEGGEPGRCAVWRGGDNGFVYQKALHRFRSHGGMIPELLMYRLRHDAETGALADAFTGTTIKHLTRESLAKVKVPVPPLPEQKRIVGKLDAMLARMDACRERLDRVPGIIKRFRQSVLAAATSGELTRQWREARGLGIWSTVKIADVATLSSGYGFPPDLQGRATGHLAFAKVSDISRAVLHDEGRLATAVNYIDELDAARIKAKPVDAGATLFAKIGEGLKLNRRALAMTRVVIDNNCMAASPKTSRIRPEYLFYVFQTIDLTPFAVATAVPSVRRSDVATIELGLPSLEEQDEIVRRTGELFAALAAVESRRAAASTHASRIISAALTKAFRGELLPQDPNDEPATDLLARLRTSADSAADAGKRKRGGSRGSRKKTTADTNMLTRKDVTPTHLTAILKERGALTAEALWTASQLQIDDFYDQLKEEEARGSLREKRGHAPDALRLLEPAA